MITWGYTDRFSWIPKAKNYTQDLALPLDCQYQPKPVYWQLQQELARVINDGIYRICPESQSDKCLAISTNTRTNTLQLYSGTCNNRNEK